MHRRARPSKATPARDPGNASAPRRARAASIEVLHQDDALILVNKPAGTWLRGGPAERPSVAVHLAEAGIVRDADEALHAVCPVDPDASGLLLIARTAPLAGQLRARMEDSALDFCTLAVVRGPVSATCGTIDQPIALRRDAGPARIDAVHGTRAVTDWRIRDAFIGFALLECRPCTAVPGQIRVHLSHAGMPLAVDSIYGGADYLMLSSFKAGYHPSRKHPERPLIRRLTLHAASVQFEHPTTGERLQFEAAAPKDFRAVLHQLAKYGRIPPR